MVFLANPPEYEALGDEFEWSENSQRENERRARAMNPALAWLNRHTRWRLRDKGKAEARRFNPVFPDGNVLDVGCAEGRDLDGRFTPYGIEISPVLGARAKALYEPRGGRVATGAAAEAIREFPPAFFSGVILASVLEHEKAPLPLLRGVRRVLRADGAVFVKVPNHDSLNRYTRGGSWSGYRYPDHVNYFTPATLKQMATLAGFRIRRLDRLAVFGDNIKAILLPVA